MSSAAEKRYSPADYLALERAADSKHEFFDGEIFAMSGGSLYHGQLAGNIITELGKALEESQCRVLTSDMRIKLPTGLYTYPDASVVCEQPKFEDGRNDVLLNPLVIIEVLSPSTESYDRGKKFEHYRSCPSLRDYVLISQDRIFVEHFTRQADSDQWLLTTWNSLDATVTFPSLNVSLPLRGIYAKIELPAVAQS